MRLKVIKALVFGALYLSFSTYALEPLKMAGKETLYQRVLTTPECAISADKSLKNAQKLPAFSLFYVYEKDGEVIKVGPDMKGSDLGYLSAKCVIDWKMQSALMFTNPASRERSLIFKDIDLLQNLVENYSKENTDKIHKLEKEAILGKAQDEIVSIEPDTFVDFKKNFYLLPILEAKETMFSDGNYTRLLHIASVTSNANKLAIKPQQNLQDYKSAVVFVIDSSISMQPYIDRTRKAISDIYEKIEKHNLKDSVNFGIVSYRSNVKAVPGLEYTSKVFLSPGDVQDKQGFLNKLKDLKQASVSSALFDEDAYSGLRDALDKINWSKYGGRYIVLITDAGAIEGNNKLSTTGLDAKEIKAESEHYGAALYALHLLTSQGKRNHNHEKAQAQYEELTFNKVLNKSLYYPVVAGDINEFGKKVDDLADSLTEQVLASKQNKTSANIATNSQIAKDSLVIGKAMQLAYLGSKLNTKVPSFFDGFISDRALLDDHKICATPVTLITKNQLSNLKQVTSEILEAANTGLLESEAMFGQLRSIAVSLGRDPNMLSQSKTLKLSQMGLLDEFLEGLPYKSLISDLDEETWSSMGADEQNQTIYDLESKLNYYQKANDDTDRWIVLNPKASKSEAVYPIPFDMLP